MKNIVNNNLQIKYKTTFYREIIWVPFLNYNLNIAQSVFRSDCAFFMPNFKKHLIHSLTVVRKKDSIYVWCHDKIKDLFYWK